jgi:Xaa-Pro aminopeptidase
MQRAIPLPAKFVNKKFEKIVRRMEDINADAWLTISREANEDPISPDLRLDGAFAWTASIIDRHGGRTAVVEYNEVESTKAKGFYDTVESYSMEGAIGKIQKVLRSLEAQKIAVNMADDAGIAHALADGLSASVKAYIISKLGKDLKKLVSSEELIFALRTEMLPEEIDLVKRSIKSCENIYDQVQEQIKVGRTDKEIYEFMRTSTFEGGMEVAWEAAPTVSIGRLPSSHTSYHNAELRDGDFLRLDFGVVKDGYCSDIQRDYWVGKGAVSTDAKRMFDTAVQAGDASILKIHEGVKGFVVDKAARQTVMSSGYPEFMHNTGHALGRLVHEIGPRLGPVWPERYGSASLKKLKQGMIFTVEPSILGPAGSCNTEQDVLVTESGGKSLSKRQEDLICVP